MKIVQNNQNTTAPHGTKKQQKKQAKHEAWLMLAINEARQEIERAEEKLTRAQQRLEKSKTELHSLLGQLEELHSEQVDQQNIEIYSRWSETKEMPEQESSTTESNEPKTNTASTASGDQQELPLPIDQEISLPPVEGRDDIPVEEAPQSIEEFQQEIEDPRSPEISLPPVEGRSDISEENTAEQIPATNEHLATTQNDLQVEQVEQETEQKKPTRIARARPATRRPARRSQPPTQETL